MRHNHNLTIAGVNLPLTSDNDERYVQILATQLTRRIESMTSQGSITKLEAALVCALDLLDENCRLKLEIEDMKKGNKQ